MFTHNKSERMGFFLVLKLKLKKNKTTPPPNNLLQRISKMKQICAGANATGNDISNKIDVSRSNIDIQAVRLEEELTVINAHYITLHSIITT